MKIDKENILQCIEKSKQCLISKQQKIQVNKNDYLTWPLFFSNVSTPSSDVDVCTSALGVIAFSKFDLEKNKSLETAVMSSINTLISIRNDDGSWPSNISLVSRDEFSMEGVISDTYFAISALLSVGFLSENPLVKEFKNLKTNSSLDTLDKRIDFLNTSVEWLLSNRVDHEQGWQYTGISYLEKNEDKDSLPAYTTPTANATIILSQIIKIIKNSRPQHAMIDKINSAINNSIRWFCDIQSNDKKDCGFGIKRGERSRIGNTARVVIALCNARNNNNQDMVDKKLHKAVNWMLKTYKPSKLSFADVGEDFHQLIVEKQSGVLKNAYRRSINHETFVEPDIIEALQLYYNGFVNAKLKFFKKLCIYTSISTALTYLLNMQKHGGDCDGAIKSRRIAVNEQYTMYTTSNFMCSVYKLCTDELLFKKVKNSSMRNKLFIISTLFFILISIGLTFFVNFSEYWITVPIGLVLSIVANVLTEKFI